jgi:hypothetical protein
MYPNQQPRESFSTYYKSHGFSAISLDDAAKVGHDKELVAYWEDPNGPTHGSVQGPTHGDRWESKCGGLDRIQHGRDELVSDSYGSIKGYWLKTSESKAARSEPLSPETVGQIQGKLATRLAVADPKLKDQFDQTYGQWQTFRHSPAVVGSSDPAAYCRGEAYQDLTKMGTQALPMLVDRAMQGDHFCQYAITAITSDRELRVAELRAHKVDCSEQDKAQQVLVQWLNSSY